jgi:YYY domain-containing protein
MAFEPQSEDQLEPRDEAVHTGLSMNSSRRRLNSTQIVTALLLAAIMLIGAYFRFVGQNWDDYTHLHPDERFLTGVAEGLGSTNLNPGGDQVKAAAQVAICKDRYPDTDGVAPSIFDSLCSTLYPKNINSTGIFVYGELPMFITTYFADLTKSVHMSAAAATPDPLDDIVARSWTTYNGIHLVGRSISASADIISIFFVFLIGRRLYNRWVGLMAAALYAAAVLPIQLSHFFTTDAFTTLPVVIAFWFAVRAMDRGRWYDFAGFGVAMGAAVASRINTALMVGVIIIAAIIYALPALDGALLGSERRRLIGKSVAGVIIAGIFTFVSFRLVMPHAFVGGPGLLGFFDIGNQRAVECLNGIPQSDITGVPLSTEQAALDCTAGKLNPIPQPASIQTLLAKVFYRPWMDDLASASQFSSGAIDFPPNHQWTNRTPYVFPLRNIVLWGLGLPLGLAAWLAWLWGLSEVIRARAAWTRHILIVVWILVYFGYMGRQWVTTMRYFALLYPFLILAASWALYELTTRAYRWSRANPTLVRQIAAYASTILLIAVIAGTFLWATMIVRIYQRQLTRVEASRWVLATLPAPVAANLTMTDGRERMVNMSLGGALSVNVSHYDTSSPIYSPFVSQSRTPVDRIIVNHLLDPQGTDTQKQFNVAIAQNSDGSNIRATGTISGTFASDKDPYGSFYEITLNQAVTLEPSETYYLMSWTNDKLAVIRDDIGEPTDFILTNANAERIAQVRLPNASNRGGEDNSGASAAFSTQPAQTRFKSPADGVIKSLTFAHLNTLISPQKDATISANILNNDQQVIGTGKLTADTTVKSISTLGNSYTFALDKPAEVKRDESYIVQLTSSTPVQVTGTVISWEGDWDDPIPWSVCTLPIEMDLTHDSPSGANPVTCEGVNGFGSGWYRGPKLSMALEDDDQKRRTIEEGLDAGDYFIISSNRFYDSLPRMPMRFPMTIAFYNALFKGELGLELVKTVASFPSLGSFEIADQNLPTFNSPSWMNEWESEEAFSVYDHPTVFIFKKTADYSSEKLAALLNSISTTAVREMDSSVIYGSKPDTKLVNRIEWNPSEATVAPTAYMLTAEQRAIQTQGGTWSDLFNRNWLVNQNQVLTLVIWWLAIMLFGFATWPLLYVLLPGLADRGYPVAKISGLLIVSWVVWAGGTLKLLTWSQWGILATLIVLAVVSLLLVRRQWSEFVEYVRTNWRHMVVVELITLALFIAFVIVKLGNPDLWAQTLGGEKPMDFAYFNAILKSTIFPAYDPWFSGGYLNYYYFGFVLVGTPVKLLGVVPAVAYNLIIPTLFALTGIGAFSVAFNLAAAPWFFRRSEGDETSDSLRERRRFALRTPRASPYIAGLMAMLLCVVLGNLDTPRTFFTGIVRAGGYASSPDDMYLWKLSEFTHSNMRSPTAEEDLQLRDEAANPSLFDQFKFGLHDSQGMAEGMSRGLSQFIRNGALPIGPERWFWSARSVVGELPNSNNEINEFPFFTFVFADLHAHMMALPLTLLALAWLLSEILCAGYFMRRAWIVIGSTLFGGLIVGSLQATNTWDWFTFLVLSILGLIFAAFMRRQQLGRRTLTATLGQLGGFYAAQWFFALPFTAYWSTAYLGQNAITSFTGNKTPTWAYADMHGIFLFIIISYLIWQTAALMRRLYMRDLAGKARPFMIVVLLVAGSVIVGFIMSTLRSKISLVDMPIPLALLLLPLIAWCGILFFVPDQSRENRIFYAIVGLALVISLGVEIVVLGADIGRQNTFFKFYMQIWTFFSIMAGLAAAWLFSVMDNWRPVLRASWLGILAILLAIGAMFPLMSTQGKNAMRMAINAPHTLDGDTYMNYATYYEGSAPLPLADDYAMIRWLQDNVKGSPVILEGSTSEYKLGTRIAISTGLPTLIGWRFHQSQQRTVDPLPNLTWQRIANVAAMYNTTDIATVWKMLKFYNVEYIVQGKLEEISYLPEGRAKWDIMVQRGLLEVVYDQNNDRIYHVISGATLPNLNVGG